MRTSKTGKFIRLLVVSGALFGIGAVAPATFAY